MIASSSVVLANLAYLLGAVVLAVIGGTVVWLRHRQPKSVDANVASFNRGLRALAPDAEAVTSPRPGDRGAPRAGTRTATRPTGLRVIRAGGDVDLAEVDLAEVDLPDLDVADLDVADADLTDSDLTDVDVTEIDVAAGHRSPDDETGAAETAGKRAGAESG